MPRSSHGVHPNETQLNISYSITDSAYGQGRELLSQLGGEEGVCTASLQIKLLPEITCLSIFIHALRTWEEHLFGVKDTTYGDVVQNKRSCKS